MKLKIFFAWYDIWIGAYIDVENKDLYICPLPMLVIKISKSEQPIGSNENAE